MLYRKAEFDPYKYHLKLVSQFVVADSVYINGLWLFAMLKSVLKTLGKPLFFLNFALTFVPTGWKIIVIIIRRHRFYRRIFQNPKHIHRPSATCTSSKSSLIASCTCVEHCPLGHSWTSNSYFQRGIPICCAISLLDTFFNQFIKLTMVYYKLYFDDTRII